MVQERRTARNSEKLEDFFKSHYYPPQDNRTIGTISQNNLAGEANLSPVNGHESMT